MMQKKLLTALCLSTFMTGGAFAAVSPEKAARLGQDLTPLGAEAGANADGSIPAWNPAGTPIPAGFVAESGNYVDPYAGEEALYTIDVNNYKKYTAELTEGTVAVFETLGADGFKMHVYPTKRDFVTPDWLYENTKRNATGATLEDGGQRVSNVYPGVPFPLPQNGLEVLWNHMTRYQTDHTVVYDSYYVDSEGSPVLSTTGYMTDIFPVYRNPDQLMDHTTWMKMRINYKAPTRRAGEILLVADPSADFTKGKGRRAWQYLIGQRRVRLAPAVNYDTPNPNTAGTSTYDDTFIFNGSPERFDWKLIGKKEMIVPYSCYDFLFQAEVKDTLGEKFLAPDMIRWEKHRVWVIEGTLKEGYRHLYSKRRFYIDEDSWQGLAGENYDGQGVMWRVGYTFGANLYDIKSNYNFGNGAYDLLQGIYNMNAKPVPGGFKNGVTQNDNYFTSKGMARSGVR